MTPSTRPYTVQWKEATGPRRCFEDILISLPSHAKSWWYPVHNILLWLVQCRVWPHSFYHLKWRKQTPRLLQVCESIIRQSSSHSLALPTGSWHKNHNISSERGKQRGCGISTASYERGRGFSSPDVEGVLSPHPPHLLIKNGTRTKGEGEMNKIYVRLGWDFYRLMWPYATHFPGPITFRKPSLP